MKSHHETDSSSASLRSSQVVRKRSTRARKNAASEAETPEELPAKSCSAVLRSSIRRGGRAGPGPSRFRQPEAEGKIALPVQAAPRPRRRSERSRGVSYPTLLSRSDGQTNRI